MESKERIKDRILKRAARVWGYQGPELETSFDPVVSMLLDACSSELEKLSAEQENAHSRVVERLIEIMSPESNAGVSPSRAILFSKPMENNFKLSTEHQFIIEKKVPNLYDPVNPTLKKITFGPTGEFNLAAASLEYMAYDKDIFYMNRSFHKESFIHSNKNLPPATLWLGIRIENDVKSLKNLMFYTDIKSSAQREIFYHYLKQVKVFHNGKEFNVKEGYNSNEVELDVESVITQNYNRIEQIYAEVNKYYYSKFIHLNDEIEIDENSFNIPPEFSENFDNTRFSEFQRVIWLQFKFPELVVRDIIDNSMFFINAYPVINKTLNFASRYIDPFVNYIPLESDEYFLDLNEISDSLGNEYTLKDFTEGNLEGGNATLRAGGVARFDERNASELIQYVIELLKDESASFSVLGGDFLDENLKQINQLIATLEQQTKEKKFTKANFPYVIVRPKVGTQKNESESISVEFWTCSGEDGNDIPPESKLVPLRGSAFDMKNIYLLTTSVGGKSKSSNRERILAYRESLLTHGRVVTFADLKAFSLNHFRDAISSIEIKKGTKINTASNMGFERSIDIIVTKNNNLETPMADSEWNYLVDNLLNKLERVSSSVYPYRVITREYEKSA